MPTILKLGGAVVDDIPTLDTLTTGWNERPDRSASWSVIHGGGPQLDAALLAVQGPPVKIAGLRVTSREGAIAAMTTLDAVGAKLVSTLQARGLPAVHLQSSHRIFRAIQKRVPDGDLGRVGTPLSVDVHAIASLVPPGTIAVVTPIGWDREGPLNINADEAACALAGALQAARLVLATDVEHVLDGEGHAIAALTAESARKLIKSGAAKGGMIPKLHSALTALDQGAREVVIGRAASAWNGQGTRLHSQTAPAASWADVMLDNYGTPGLTLVRGRGSKVWDHEGNAYTDLLGGIAVTVLGHAHPDVNAAAKGQLDALSHTSNLYAHLPGLELAARLRAYAPEHKVFFCNSGTEANEAALKLVRRHAHATNRPNGVVLAFEHGFHGRTSGALALTWNPKYQQGFTPLPEQIVHIPFNDPRALAAAFANHDVVGVFAEPIQGEGGVVPMTAELAGTLAAACKEHDAILVMDEVQTGIGRTGRFFAHEHLNLKPDVITLAKGIAGGLPLGATLIHESKTALLGPGSHGSTFGGNPVSCAAANAVLQAIEDDDLMQEATRKGRIIETFLDEMGIAHRGMGLLQGIIVEGAGEYVKRAQAAGVLLGTAGDVVRLAPALTIPDVELIDALSSIWVPQVAV